MTERSGAPLRERTSARTGAPAFGTTGVIRQICAALFSVSCAVACIAPKSDHYYVTKPDGEPFRTGGGAVYASDPADAARVASCRDDVAPMVAAVFRTETAPIDVWVLDEEFPGPFAAVLARGEPPWINLGRESRDVERIMLAHELGHWCIWRAPADRWSALPLLVQEGLCDVAAMRAVPEDAMQMGSGYVTMLRRIASIGDAGAALSTSSGDLHVDTDERLAGALYAMGFVVAARLGVDGLSAACDDAKARGQSQVSASDLLERCGLAHAGPDEWRAAMQAFTDFGSFQTRIRFRDGEGKSLGTAALGTTDPSSIPPGTVSQSEETYCIPAKWLQDASGVPYERSPNGRTL